MMSSLVRLTPLAAALVLTGCASTPPPATGAMALTPLDTWSSRVQVIAQPEEIAHAVLFLAAPESSYLNGAIIPVDGGWLAGYSRDF